MWNTYYNIKSWFENWETDMVKLGFSNCDIEDEIVISKKQLKRILNIDETCSYLNGSKIQRGGRPAVIFYHRKFSQLGMATINTSITITMICSITAAG